MRASGLPAWRRGPHKCGPYGDGGRGGSPHRPRTADRAVRPTARRPTPRGEVGGHGGPPHGLGYSGQPESIHFWKSCFCAALKLPLGGIVPACTRVLPRLEIWGGGLPLLRKPVAAA